MALVVDVQVAITCDCRACHCDPTPPATTCDANGRPFEPCRQTYTPGDVPKGKRIATRLDVPLWELVAAVAIGEGWREKGSPATAARWYCPRCQKEHLSDAS